MSPAAASSAAVASAALSSTGLTARVDSGTPPSGGGSAGTVTVDDSRWSGLEADLASARQELAGLRSALVSRATIDQARGILIARYKISADGAFELLVRWSQDRNIKLRVIAETLVSMAEHGVDALGVDRSLGRWLGQQLADPSAEQ